MRVVSLIASSTEVVCALGKQGNLVGISHECDFPLSIKSLPICSETKFLPDGKSYEIDARIKALLQEGLSIYRVLGEQLKELQPDVIITQTQCEVCAVSEKDVMQATCEYLAASPKIVSMRTNCLADLWTDITKIAHAIGAELEGQQLVSSLQSRLKKIQARGEKLASHLGKPTVACIEWFNPLMVAGNWVPELVEIAGGKDLFGQAGSHSPYINWEKIHSANPDKILLMPCGWGVSKIKEELYNLTTLSGWQELKAVKNQDVFICDGNSYFNRPGPRLVDSAEIIQEVLFSSQLTRTFTVNDWIAL